MRSLNQINSKNDPDGEPNADWVWQIIADLKDGKVREINLLDSIKLNIRLWTYYGIKMLLPKGLLKYGTIRLENVDGFINAYNV